MLKNLKISMLDICDVLKRYELMKNDVQVVITKKENFLDDSNFTKHDIVVIKVSMKTSSIT